MGEIEAGATAAFLYYGSPFDGIEYAFYAIVNREDKAGGKLLQRRAGIHQCRGVGKEIKAEHQLEKIGFDVRCLFFGLAILFFCLRYVVRHPPEHFVRGFAHPAAAVTEEIALCQHDHGI